MLNRETKICQSCGMPLENDKLLGTNADGSKNQEYCLYCFKDGAFTNDVTMEEEIEACVPFVSKGNPWQDENTARNAMKELFPQLKRWKK